MNSQDRNLLRAQLLIEAADLLDEGYNKPNTNDRIRAVEQKEEINKRAKEYQHSIDMGYADEKDAAKALRRMKRVGIPNAKYISQITSQNPSDVRWARFGGTHEKNIPNASGIIYSPTMDTNAGGVTKRRLYLPTNKEMHEYYREKRGDSKDPLAINPGRIKKLEIEKKFLEDNKKHLLGKII